jgi:DinB superfamily
MMTTKAGALADKLLSEGERTLTFFRSLQPAAWQKRVYGEGSGWVVRDAFEHLIISEETLQQLFERVVREGRGVDEDFSADRFNAEHTGELAGLSWDELHARYTATRRSMAEFTRPLSDEQLAVRARHPALGITSLEEMIKLIYVHHSMHMRDVRRVL